MVNASLLRNATEDLEKEISPVKLRFLNNHEIPFTPRFEKFTALRNPKFNYGIDPTDAEMLKVMAFDHTYTTRVKGNNSGPPLSFKGLPARYQDFFNDCMYFFLY